MNEKHEKIEDENLIYCFVILGDFEKNEASRFFLVRSKEVAEAVKKEHDYYLKDAKKTSKKINESDKTRCFRLVVDQDRKGQKIGLKCLEDHENNWNLISKILKN